MKIGIIVALFVAAFIALVAYSTLQGPRYRVRVCMTYEGRTSCRTVSSKSEQGALRGGTENACADITSGVTATVACQQSPPASVQWLHKPSQ